MITDLAKAHEVLVQYRAELEKRKNEPDLVAFMLRNEQPIQETDLATLAWSLGSNVWGCHYNDVKGLLDIFEAHITQQEKGW
jgi:hypothetical protein